MAADASALFNLLTGYSQGHHWRKLVVAPTDLHRRTIELIDEQAQRAREGRPSRIFAKLNSLVDYRVIEALYRASQAGVPIDLIDPRHLLPAARAAGHFREHPRAEHRRSVSGAQPDLRVRPRRRCPDLSGQRRLDAAQLLSPRGGDVPDRIAGSEGADSARDRAGLSARQRQGPHPAARRQLHPAAAAGRRRPYRCQERLLALHPAVAAETRPGGNGALRHDDLRVAAH